MPAHLPHPRPLSSPTLLRLTRKLLLFLCFFYCSFNLLFAVRQKANIFVILPQFQLAAFCVIWNFCCMEFFICLWSCLLVHLPPSLGLCIFVYEWDVRFVAITNILAQNLHSIIYVCIYRNYEWKAGMELSEHQLWITKEIYSSSSRYR